MKYLILFFNWLKSALAKEILLTVLSILIALVLSFITNTVLEYSIKDGNPDSPTTLQSELRNLEIGKLQYWIYLFVFFMLIIYAVRLVEAVIKTVLIAKPQKQ